MTGFVTHKGQLAAVAHEEQNLIVSSGDQTLQPRPGNPVLKMNYIDIVDGEPTTGAAVIALKSDTAPADPPGTEQITQTFQPGDMVAWGNFRGKIEQVQPDPVAGFDEPTVQVRLYDKSPWGYATTERIAVRPMSQVTKINTDSKRRMTGTIYAKNGELTIYADIGSADWGGVSTAVVKDELDKMGVIKNLTVRINSYGGDVFDGYGIYNLLKAHPAKLTVVIDGIAASAASVIAMAGDVIRMPAASQMMIHRGWTFAMGNRNDIEKTLARLDKTDQQIAEIYTSRTGIEAEEVLQMMTDETWMTGAEAVDKGFATELVEDSDALPIAASGRSWVRNAPKVSSTAQYRAKHLARAERLRKSLARG
jgi:ATP-dependent protease ClpP protease subunit